MATREEWIGRVGQEWARRADALERLLGSPGAAGLAALAAGPGERVLDLGCGAGNSTVRLSDAVGAAGHVTAVDVSPDLVSVARARLAGRANVTVTETDAGTHPFAPGAHDALHSRFGSMFFDEPPAALANLRRALTPAGRAVFVAWRAPKLNLWAALPISVAPAPAAPPAPGAPAATPEPGAPGPFGWADEGIWRPLLEGAGFTRVTAREHDFMAELSDGDDPDPVARAVFFASRIGPFASRLRDAPEETRRAAMDALAERLSGHVHDGAVRLPAAAWIIEARAGE